MKNSHFFIFMTVTLLVGCAQYIPVPYKRPMQQAYVALLPNPISIYVPKVQKGIAIGYALQDSTRFFEDNMFEEMRRKDRDSRANSGSEAVALDAVTQIAQKIKPDDLNSLLLERMIASKEKLPDGINFQMDALNTIDASNNIKPANGLLIELSYTFYPSAEILRVSATINLNFQEIAYKTPYADVFMGAIPESQKKGPIYRNSFDYKSTPLPENLRSRYLSLKENIAISLTHWLANDAALLKQELASAHDFVIRQLFRDLSNYTVPNVKGIKGTKLEGDEHRTVYLHGEGSISSKPNVDISHAPYDVNGIMYPNVISITQETVIPKK